MVEQMLEVFVDVQSKLLCVILDCNAGDVKQDITCLTMS